MSKIFVKIFKETGKIDIHGSKKIEADILFLIEELKDCGLTDQEAINKLAKCIESELKNFSKNEFLEKDEILLTTYKASDNFLKAVLLEL